MNCGVGAIDHSVWVKSGSCHCFQYQLHRMESLALCQATGSYVCVCVQLLLLGNEIEITLSLTRQACLCSSWVAFPPLLAVPTWTIPPPSNAEGVSVLVVLMQDLFPLLLSGSVISGPVPWSRSFSFGCIWRTKHGLAVGHILYIFSVARTRDLYKEDWFHLLGWSWFVRALKLQKSQPISMDIGMASRWCCVMFLLHKKQDNHACIL